MLLTMDWPKFNAAELVMKFKNLNIKQLQSIFEKAYLTFYMRPKMLSKLNKNSSTSKSAFKAAKNTLIGAVSGFNVALMPHNKLQIRMANLALRLKNLFFLTPLGSKPSNGESLPSLSPCLTLSSKYS